jgi:hypothetical protein
MLLNESLMITLRTERELAKINSTALRGTYNFLTSPHMASGSATAQDPVHYDKLPSKFVVTVVHEASRRMLNTITNDRDTLINES